METTGFLNSLCHLRAAYFFAVQAGEIENHDEYSINERMLVEHAVYSTGAVEFSVMFLESVLNELFYDQENRLFKGTLNLSAAARETVIDIWEKTNSGSTSLIKKLNYLLHSAGKERVRGNEVVYQEAENLIKLRNYLINYQPETFRKTNGINQGLYEKSEIETSLMGRFNLNGIAKEGSPFFPDKCLGFGCALWSVRVSVNLADELLSRLGLTLLFIKHLEEYMMMFKRD